MEEQDTGEAMEEPVEDTLQVEEWQSWSVIVTQQTQKNIPAPISP